MGALRRWTLLFVPGPLILAVHWLLRLAIVIGCWSGCCRILDVVGSMSEGP